MYSINDLVFPVLILGKDPSESKLSITDDPVHLKVATKLSLQRKSLLNSLIFDSTGKIFEVTAVNCVRPLNPFWKFEFFNPMYKIQIKLRLMGIIHNLDQLRVKVLDNIIAEQELWEENLDVYLLKKKLKTSKSVKQLLKALL